MFNLGDQLGGPGTPAKMLEEPEGPPEIFPRVQPCSPIVEFGSAFCEDISKGMEILVNYPILLTYMVVILM